MENKELIVNEEVVLEEVTEVEESKSLNKPVVIGAAALAVATVAGAYFVLKGKKKSKSAKILSAVVKVAKVAKKLK